MNVTIICENLTRFYYDGKPILEKVCNESTTLTPQEVLLIGLAGLLLLIVFLYYTKKASKEDETNK